MEFKLFDKYDVSEIRVEDPGLQKYVNLDKMLVVKTHGRHSGKFGNAKVNIIERFINLLGVPGHRGKKHKVQTKWSTGKYAKNTKIMLETLQIIQEKTGQNPVQVVIKAVENSAPSDEVTTIEYGGARYPQAVDIAPLRRLSLAIRNLVHGGYDKAFNKKTTIAQGLATEIIASAEDKPESFSAKKRNETEKQADSAR